MNGFVTERERRTDIVKNCQVLVAGGGIAGIAAAIAAARGGKKVTLIEREYMLGGLATLGLVTIYLPLCDGQGTQVIYGIAEELLKFSIEHGAEGPVPTAWMERRPKAEREKMRYITQFNPHLFALTVERMLRELGVEIIYGTVICGVERQDDVIKAVIVENKSGRTAIEAGAVIDCTGDADVCSLAGAPTALHAGGNGLASWYYYFSKGEVRLKMFGLADVVTQGSEDTQKAAESDETYKAAKTVSLDKNIRFSGVDGYELSDALQEAHSRMLDDILDRQKSDPKYVPVTVSTIPLVRMSRRIDGEYVLSESEERAHFDDSIGMTGDWRRPGPVFEIPYRTLYTKKIKNLLAAGRAISVDDDMWDVTRVIPPCAVTGQAAGTAAALTDDFAALDVALLQRELKTTGVCLHTEELDRM